jgi:hypothetical protein
MRIFMKKLFLVLPALFFFQFILFGQHEQQVSEIESTVPELTAFHKTIYPMWHKAYPDKDYDLFKKLLPDVNTGVEKIFSAELPGILRDKKEEWENGIKNLRSSAESFNKAVKDNNETDILSSAEALHSDYEKLVRIVRPVTKEVDEYHKVLYMLYHHYVPGRNTDETRTALDNLMMRADSLQNSVLPKWAAAKSDDFRKLSDELHTATKELHAVKDAEFDVIEKELDTVHTKYQKLEGLFD